MAVIGGGVIGLELGSVYQRLGTQVTVLQHTERICPFLDAEIGKAFQNSLKKQGLSFMLNSRVASGVNNKANGVSLNVVNAKDNKETKLDVDVCLVSIGRRPFTDGLGLENTGVQMNERNQIITNDHWQTNVPNIYGIGDVCAGAMLAHKEKKVGRCHDIQNGGRGISWQAV